MKISLLRKYIMVNEGIKQKTYEDSLKKKTVGIGFYLEKGGAKERIEQLGLDYQQVMSGKQDLTLRNISNLFKDDLKQAIADAKSIIKNFDQLSDTRQHVLVDMAFNMGKSKLAKFEKMIAAIEKNQWDVAANEMKDSKWYNQVHRRGEWNVAAMQTDMMPSFEKEVSKEAKECDQLLQLTDSVKPKSALEKFKEDTSYVKTQERSPWSLIKAKVIEPQMQPQPETAETYEEDYESSMSFRPRP